MSALDTTLSAAPKLVPQAPDLWAMDQPSRAAVLDSVISKSRAATPAAVEDKRAIKRLSIEELNNMDIEAIQQRWANSRFDSRDAVTKFLDVIDIPRNVLMGTLAPSLRRKAEERGDIAALGQGRVNFSDVLESMGVENRVVRGVVGFVGDVLFDPLTYAGGAGFIKAVAQGGKEIALVKKFDKVFKATVREVAGSPRKGLAIPFFSASADPLIERYFRAAGYTPEKIAELRAAGKTPKQIEEELSALYNRRSPRWTRKQDPLRVKAQTARVDPQMNTLADDIVSVGVGPNERLDAAKAIYEKYGRGSAPQLRLGKKPRVISGKAGVVDPGTGIASIPFTNLEVTIPTRFSVGARSAAVTGRLATIAKNLEAMDAAKYAPEVVASVKAGEASLEELGRALDELDNLGEPPPAGTVERQAYDARKSAVVQKVNDAEAGVRNASTQTTVQLAKLQPSEWAQAEKIAELSRANVLAYAAVRVRAKTAAAAKELVENIRDVRREFEAGTKSLTAKYAKELEAQGMDPVLAVSEASKRAKAEYLVNQEEAVQNIINLSEESVRAREQYADSLHELMRMDRLVADATKGPALAMLSSKEIEQIDFAKEILGLGDSAGYGLFASIRAAAQPFAAANNYALDDSLARMSRASEVTFGNRSGWAYEIQRKYQQMANGVFGEAGQVAYDEFNTALWDIANIHAKSPSQAADIREDLGRFLYAMLDRDIAKTPLVDGAGKPTGTAKLLATMEAKGYLDDAMFPGMKNALQSLQERWGELLSNVSEFERRQGYRKTTAENYVPSTITGEASAAIRELNVSGLESSPGVSTRAATGGEQAFQQERSRYLYEWDGGAKYFTAGEREKYMAFTREQLDAIGPPGTFQRDHIDRVRAAVAEYDAMPNYLRPAPRLLDPFELNERVMNGQTFSVLTGGRKIAFYDEDAAIVLGKRLAQSERAYYDKYLFDYLDSQKVLINVKQVLAERGNVLNTGDTIRLPSGAMARVESAGRDEFVFVIGGERYRQSKPMQSSIYNPYSGIENGTAFQAYYPERLSDLMERTTEVYRDEGVFQRALQSADEIQKLWKSTTLMHPSWVISNLLTFVVQAPMMGLLPTDIAAKFRTALQIIKAGRNEELLAKIAVEAGGVTRNGIDIAITNPARDDVFTGTQSLEAIGHLLANGTFMLPPKHQLFSKGLIENPAEHVRLVLNEIKDRGIEMTRADAAGSALSRMRPIEVARQAKNIVVDAGLYERLWAPFARVNAKMEQTLRLASYLALLDKGHDLVSAGRIVREHLFDMSTLTRTETQYLRRFAPFYSWLRASTVYGMRQVMHNPRYFTFPPKLKESIEEFINGEQDVPNYMRPSWLNETLAMQLGTDPDNRFVFNSLSLMPQESSIRALSMLGAPVLGASAAMDGLAYFGNSLTPLLKIPGEITSGREWYTQRTIGGDPNTGDLSLQEYLLGQIRPLRELGVGNVRQSPIGAAFERSPAEGVARLTIGGRIQPFTEERRLFALRRELKQREDSIRARIRISEREGAKEASLAAREELLRLYVRMQEVGLGDDVPKFARRQLDQLNSGGGGGV